MDATFDDDRVNEYPKRAKHWTTIVLEEQEDGEWLATQGGVPVEGYGETAAAAAAEYCRKVGDDSE